MLKKIINWCAIALCAMIFTGCAAPKQSAISLGDDYIATTKAKNARIGVAVVELPKPNTFFPGADCLLCIAVASAAHTSMSKQVDTFSVDELKTLPTEIVSLLSRSGVNAVAIPEPLKLNSYPEVTVSQDQNKARRNFSSVKSTHGVDRLLVVQVDSLGITRPYSAYVPAGAPRASIDGAAYIVNVGSGSLEWYMPIQLSRGADGAWDEPSKYPGLTNAFYQAIEAAKDSIKQPFTRK